MQEVAGESVPFLVLPRPLLKLQDYLSSPTPAEKFYPPHVWFGWSNAVFEFMNRNMRLTAFNPGQR